MLSKLREVEREYERKKAPLYSARGEVIKNIPGFWLHCFMQHQEIRHIIDDVDEEILSSLVEVTFYIDSMNIALCQVSIDICQYPQTI